MESIQLPKVRTQMQIEWNILYPFDPAIINMMERAADLCLQYESVHIPCSISVCLCDDGKIKSINQEFRHIDHSTDVLSFPTINYLKGQTAGQCEKLLRQEYDDESGSCFLGDLIISVPHIQAQAKEYGHSEMREAAYLLVHGICHLMGYDHIENDEKEIMRKMEEKVLSSISADRNAPESFSDEMLLEYARKAMKNSYSPYSHFPVGAALLTATGKIFTGCNIENASYGLSNCAERTAVFKAVSEGEKQFSAIAIAAKAKAWPCGACRQVLNEFAPRLRILVTWEDKVEEKKLSELLPENFGPANMIVSGDL